MARKVEFDFNSIAVLGFKFDLPKGGAAKIASNAGLGSERNENLITEGTFDEIHLSYRSCFLSRLMIGCGIIFAATLTSS